MTLTAHTSCPATSCADQESTPQASIDDPALALAAADAAVAAATCLLRRALARRDATAASKPGVAAAAVPVVRPAAELEEEFTLGSGWPPRA